MKERLTLLDLRRRTGVVKVGEDEVEVHGLSALAIHDLMARYDEVQKFLVNIGISVAEAIKAAPGVSAAIIARGMVLPPGLTLDEAERVASDLAAQTQVDLVLKIWEMTFTRGFGPFVETMRAIAGAVSVAGAGKGQDTTSGKPLRAMHTNTQGPTPKTHGASPPGSSPPGTSSPSADTSGKTGTAST